MIYCGPTEWRFERRRGSSIDRKNTVRHLIQMMAITEEGAGQEATPSPVPPQPEGKLKTVNKESFITTLQKIKFPICKKYKGILYKVVLWS